MPGVGGNAATVGTVRGLNRRSVKNAAMTLSSWLSSGAKARREAATNGQRISASQPSVTFPRAMIQTLDVRPPINTDRRPASRVGVLGCGSIGSNAKGTSNADRVGFRQICVSEEFFRDPRSIELGRPLESVPSLLLLMCPPRRGQPLRFFLSVFIITTRA